MEENREIEKKPSNGIALEEMAADTLKQWLDLEYQDKDKVDQYTD